MKGNIDKDMANRNNNEIYSFNRITQTAMKKVTSNLVLLNVIFIQRLQNIKNRKHLINKNKCDFNTCSNNILNI